MKSSIAIVIFLLPYMSLALYDELSPRKLKLEDIEEEHLQSERRAKAASQPQSLPPPLSKQPAKGQPTKTYPPITKDHIEEYHKQKYSTRAQQHIQPLTDQPTAPEADYQQSPAYQRETIVYLPTNAHRQPLLQRSPSQQQYEQQQPQQQQQSPVFYYSHDVQHQDQQQPSGNDYQVEFVPIGQHGGSDEQRHYEGPRATASQASAGNQVVLSTAPTSVVSYSHESGQAEEQHQEAVQYVSQNEIREPNNAQRVYGLPESVFFESQKDIEYAKPASTYGEPPRTQQPYSNPQAIEYTTLEESPLAHRPSPAYGAPKSPVPYFPRQKDIQYAPQVEAEAVAVQKPAISYGPPDTVGQVPQIQYGVPDAPFRRPLAQSNQNAYAPRRPDSSARSNEKPFAISFPYPPSFVSITTERPFYEKAAPNPEPSYNEVSQWQANVMPLHLIPPQAQENQYRSFGATQAIQAPAAVDNSHIDSHSIPLIDFFHTRRSKSLIDSYIPSWLIARMQEEHARQQQQQQYSLQQQQHRQQQSYAVPSPTAETGYNTIAYSTQFENIYGKDFKRSIQRGKGHQKKPIASVQQIPVMA